MDSSPQQTRRQAVAWALKMTAGTPLAPTVQERLLLAAFVQGRLSITHVESVVLRRRQRFIERRTKRAAQQVSSHLS